MGIFGAPQIIQSDNGKEFRNQVLASLKIIWPGIEVIHGRPRRPQSQGSIERCNGDVQDIIGSFMRLHNTTKWAVLLPLIALTKNGKYNAGIYYFFVCEFIIF